MAQNLAVRVREMVTTFSSLSHPFKSTITEAWTHYKRTIKHEKYKENLKSTLI